MNKEDIINMAEENNDTDFTELNQAISNVIEHQLEDMGNEDDHEQDQDNENKNVIDHNLNHHNQCNGINGNLQLMAHDDYNNDADEDDNNNLLKKGIRHYSIDKNVNVNTKHKQKQSKLKNQVYYSPDIRKSNPNNGVYLSPLATPSYSQYATPNMNPRQIWTGSNMPTAHNDNNNQFMLNYGYLPHAYQQYPHIYNSPQNYYSNEYMINNNMTMNNNNVNYFTLNNFAHSQFNDDMILNKSINNQSKEHLNHISNSKDNSKKNKKKKGKAYISQSPTLKSLFANGITNGTNANDQRMNFFQKKTGYNLFQKEKKNHINLEPIITGVDKRTSLMIKNIPNKYTIGTFLEEINADFNTKYDIFYLPIDYENKCNLGFAFINFVEPLHIVDFYDTHRGKKWKRFNSEKICELVYAKIQGKKELIAHFEKGKVLLFDSEDKRPLILPTPSPLPLITIPGKYLQMFMMAYPFATYHSISNDKFGIESLFTF